MCQAGACRHVPTPGPCGHRAHCWPLPYEAEQAGVTGAGTQSTASRGRAGRHHITSCTSGRPHLLIPGQDGVTGTVPGFPPWEGQETGDPVRWRGHRLDTPEHRCEAQTGPEREADGAPSFPGLGRSPGPAAQGRRDGSAGPQLPDKGQQPAGGPRRSHPGHPPAQLRSRHTK